MISKSFNYQHWEGTAVFRKKNFSPKLQDTLSKFSKFIVL